MWSIRPAFQFLRYAAVSTAVLCCMPAFAQEGQPQQKTQQPKPYGGGSPLDVIMNTRLWTDVPEAKDFVKATRPPEESLDYQPTTGTEPARPKVRSAAELKDLETELESAGAHNERAGGLRTRHFSQDDGKKAKVKRTAAKSN